MQVQVLEVGVKNKDKKEPSIELESSKGESKKAAKNIIKKKWKAKG